MSVTPMQVSELKGHRALRALNVYHTLLLGIKMIPEYMAEGFEDFLDRIELLSDSEKLSLLKKAASFVELKQDEIEALVCFCKDKNGVSYGPENLKSMNINQILDAIVSVCFEISKIKIDLITKDEKKNLKTSQSI